MTAQQPEAAQESLGKLLKRSEQTLLRAKSSALKETGLTLPQYVALAELDQHPGITAAELARACLVSPQAMMVALKGMQEQGLVERHPHPRHRTVLEIHLTAVGREALHTGRELVEPIEQQIAHSMSPAETATLRELLTRCIGALNASDA
ncbi:MAG: MarR family winged helix-turn-helix transcriptional regulator [Solirubrobacteraceae bacterium]